jgi:hypothetical protein
MCVCACVRACVRAPARVSVCVRVSQLVGRDDKSKNSSLLLIELKPCGSHRVTKLDETSLFINNHTPRTFRVKLLYEYKLSFAEF